MKKTAHILCALLLFGIGQVFAQNFQVTGRVFSQSGNTPLSGVTVSIKGTDVNALTNNEGNFIISVPSSSTLVFTYAGMNAEQRVVNKAAHLNITMSLSLSSSMEEIVVVGYGTQKKSVVTGAISKISASDLDNQPISRVEQFLQGRASGLTIAASSGQPGSSSTVRVRGTTSITSSDPLYVIDGIPADINGIDFLNSNDIESIEVLKDAASAAIYGARAAAGVILITTKKGRPGSLTVTYNGYYGTQAPANRLKLLNARQYATLQNEASLNDGGNIIYSNPASLGKGTDWQDIIFNDQATIQNHEISISGGNERSTYYTSFGYFDQQGIVASAISNYKRFNVRFNATHKLSKRITVGNNFGYSYIKSLGIGNTNSEYGGVLSSAINLDPLTKPVITDPTEMLLPQYNNGIATVRDANGNPYGISDLVAQEMANPLAFTKTRLGNHGWSHNLVGNFFAEVEPIKGFKIKSNIGAKLAFWGNESFAPIYYFHSANSSTINSLYRESNRGLNYSWENTASYTRSFGDHNFTALVGTGAYYDNYLTRNGGVTYRNLSVNTYKEASMNINILPANLDAWGGEYTPHIMSSIYGRLIYNYREKYLFTGIIRRDGSSRFGTNKKYGYFPSASLGWVASKEAFWPQNKYVDFFKLRGSYGVTGSDILGDFRYVSTIGGGRNYTYGIDDMYTLGNSPNALSNPDLQWEETSQTDIGFDATFLKRFTLSFDWYNKKTTGMLRPIQVPLYVGVGGPTANVATMENKGIEIELGYHQNFGAVKVEFKGNVSTLKNRVTYLGDGIEFLDDVNSKVQSTNYPISRTAIGHAFNSFYGFRRLGIFQTQAEVNDYKNKLGDLIQPKAVAGDIKWADLNNDGVINADDQTFIGDPTPKVSYGFTANAEYRGFDLSIFAQGAAGNKIYNGLRRLDIPNANWTTKALDRWTGPGTSNSTPRVTKLDPNQNYSNPSDFYLEDGSYLRLKMVQVGYSIRSAFFQKAGIQKLRVYVSGNNLVTFTKYTGFDPEIGGGSFGIDRGFYPQARSFTAGLNLSF